MGGCFTSLFGRPLPLDLRPRPDPPRREWEELREPDEVDEEEGVVLEEDDWLVVLLVVVAAEVSEN